VGCSSPNSQRCHLSEMYLTRQRLVTFLRDEMCAAVLQGVEAPGSKREDCRSVISTFVSVGTFVTNWLMPIHGVALVVGCKSPLHTLR